MGSYILLNRGLEVEQEVSSGYEWEIAFASLVFAVLVVVRNNLEVHYNFDVHYNFEVHNNLEGVGLAASAVEKGIHPVLAAQSPRVFARSCHASNLALCFEWQ